MVVVVSAAAALLVVMVVVVAAAAALLVVMVVVVSAAAVLFVVMVMMVVLLLHLGQLCCQGCLALHGLHYLGSGQGVPGGGDNGGLGIQLPEQLHRLIQLVLGDGVRPGQNDGRSGLHLVIIELTEVLAVGFYLAGVHHRHGIAQGHILAGYLVHRTDDIGKLAYAGGLNHNPVGVVVRNHLGQGLAEVAHQTAADAAGVHLPDVDACILQKAAVNADFAKLVFNQHQLLALVSLLQQLLNEGGFACAQETTVNINFCHNQTPSVNSVQPSKSPGLPGKGLYKIALLTVCTI